MESFRPTINSDKVLALTAKTIKKTIEGADRFLQASINGEHKVLKTRWSRINKMLLGGFHFGQIYMIGGASGHGKSYFLNMLQRDFMSNGVNDPKFKFKILHFGFEMSAEAEFLRRVAAVAKVPYRKLVSSDDPLTEAEYARVKSFYSKMGDDPIYTFEVPGTRLEIEATIKAFKKRFTDHELVITLDHTLLVTSERGEDEIKTLTELGKLFIRLKKEFNILIIVLAQLNDKIESERRRDPTNPALHFPTKTDFHGSKQLYHAVDVALIIHQPALLNLEYYGKQNIPTKDLIVIHQVKQRSGSQGFVRMENNLKHGEILQKDTDDDAAKRKIADALQGKRIN